MPCLRTGSHAIEEAGIPLQAVSLAGQLDNLERYVADDALKGTGKLNNGLRGSTGFPKK